VLVAGVASIRQASGGFGAPAAEGVVAGGAATTLLKGKRGMVAITGQAIMKTALQPGYSIMSTITG